MANDTTRHEPQEQKEQQRVAVLDPVSRLSEVLFGLLMVLTFTTTFSIANGGTSAVKELLVASIGCNIAWGIVDAAVFLIARLVGRARLLQIWKQLKQLPPGSVEGVATLDDALPPGLVKLMTKDERVTLHQRLRDAEMPHDPMAINRQDIQGAVAVFCLVFLATLPPILPFVLMADPLQALRVSNLIAVVMMFAIGRELGKYAGADQPWQPGVAFAGFGAVLVMVTVLLGG